jgi:hypothetical protein
MGSFSLWHWLIVLVVIMLGAAIYLVGVLGRSRTRRVLSNLWEQRIYEGNRLTLDGPNPDRVPLAFLLGFWTFALLIGLTVLPIANISRDLLIWLGFGLSIPIYVLVVIAVFVHMRPNHSRQLKYSLVMASLPLPQLLLAPSIALHALGHVYGAEKTLLLVGSAVGVLVTSWSVLVVAAIALLGRTWIKRSSQGHPPLSPWERFVFALVHLRYAGPLFFICFLLSANAVLVMLAIRYVAVERFRYQPIVYLRSFHHKSAGEIFGRSIAPGVASLGVIKALVHDQQKGSVLLSSASIWQFGLLATVPDTHWQEWVTKDLARACLVIIDSSILTRGVQWEIDAALLYVKRENLLIITDGRELELASPPITILHYTGQPNALAQLRSSVATWGRSALPGYRDWLMPATVVAWAFVLLVGCLEYALVLI